MPPEPTLRAVPPLGQGEPPRSDAPQEPPWWRTRAPLILAAAFLITFVVLLYSRHQMGSEITALEARIQELRSDVAVRDHVIDAQQGRLGEVREEVGQLQQLLDRPLPSVDEHPSSHR